MKEVVIAGYLRTAQSRSRPNDPARDWFCKLRADALLAKLLPEIISRTGVDEKEISEAFSGVALNCIKELAWTRNRSTSGAAAWPSVTL